jgi:hypothetical protein
LSSGRPIASNKRIEHALVAALASARNEAALAQMLGEYKLRHVLEHGHFDRLPLAGFLAPVERSQDALSRNEADHVIDKDQRHETRFAKHPLVAGGNAGHALDDRVVGRPVVIGTVLAKSRERADDKPGITRS